MKALLAGILLVVWSPEAHAAADWRFFTTETSGCTLTYPASHFLPKPTPDADGGRSFTSTLPETSLVIAGGPSAEALSMDDIMRTYFRAVGGVTITYRRHEPRWAVYSGYRQGQIYYLKVLLSADGHRACVFELSYPQSVKRALDPIVARISSSLRIAPAGVASR
jgi:hypothetical protein